MTPNCPYTPKKIVWLNWVDASQVCNVGPSKSPPQPNTPPLHPALGRCKYSSLWIIGIFSFCILIRLPCAKHLNFWITQNATNWAVKAGWWSLLLSRSCWSASSLGGRPSPSRCRGTSPFGGSSVRRSFWSTPLSSSTFSNPTMCRSRRRSTSGWDLRLEVQQVHIAVCKTMWSCQLTSILMTGTPVRHRDPPGVEVQRVEGDLDGELVNETREEKKDKWNFCHCLETVSKKQLVFFIQSDELNLALLVFNNRISATATDCKLSIHWTFFCDQGNWEKGNYICERICS